jgi:hypothetical protein
MFRDHFGLAVFLALSLLIALIAFHLSWTEHIHIEKEGERIEVISNWTFNWILFLPVFAISALIGVSSLEIFHRKVSATEENLRSWSPLRIYRQSLEISEIMDARTFNRVTEVCYKNRWIVFFGNSCFRREVDKGFLKLNPLDYIQDDQPSNK